MRAARHAGALIVAALSAPMLVAIAAVRSPTWYPTFDWALMELRTRDVAAHLPLVGPTGRFFGPGGEIGHHLGPIGFYLVAPVYRLLGGSAFALVTSTAFVNVVAIAVAMWVGRRRGGMPVMAGVAASIAVLAHAVGAEQLVVPWNPWLPMLWWVVFLLAVWSVVCDDLPVLPLVAFAGTVCAQSHMAFVPSVVAMVVGVLVVVAAREARRRSRRAVSWLGAMVAVFGVLWLPVLVEQLTRNPGNLTIVQHHFSRAATDTVGLAAAVDTWLAHLDPLALVLGRQRFDGAPVPGALLVLALVLALVLTARARSLRVASLLAVVTVAAVANLASIARIDGPVLPYLVLWTWGTTAIALFAIAWAVVDRAGVIASRVLVALALAVVAVAVGAGTLGARGARPQFAGLSEILRQSVPVLVDALAPDRRYMLRSDDPFAEVGLAYGLLDALEREGFDVRLPPTFEAVVGEHRLVADADVDAEIVYATGDRIARWRGAPGVREVAFVAAPEPDVVRLQVLRAEVFAVFEAHGLGPLAGLVDENLFTLTVDPITPPDAVPVLERMLELQVPAAFFVVDRRPIVTQGG